MHVTAFIIVLGEIGITQVPVGSGSIDIQGGGRTDCQLGFILTFAVIIKPTAVLGIIQAGESKGKSPLSIGTIKYIHLVVNC